ncbi:vWA domain-containing protein [Bifidobacterium pullorum]|uniref:vWA domain-containing protein n=1 Tax=Bifidobacterium pullorum TaxID=78448 RepID=UPI00242DC030|nr:VWA domain-containing protein [Bifidobacterium pullorum]
MPRKYYDIEFSPVIIALDVSSSMETDDSGNHPLQVAEGIIPQLAELGKHFPTVDDMTRIGLITFSSSAEVQLPVGEVGRLSDLAGKSVNFKPQGLTYYGAAFKLIHSELQQVRQRLFEHEHLEGLSVGYHRPVVFFITDGRPNDSDADRKAAWEALVGDDELSPHFVTFGVGNVRAEHIAPYCNRRGRVLLARDPANVARDITDLIELMCATIVTMNDSGPSRRDDESLFAADHDSWRANFDVLNFNDQYDVL